MVRIIALVIGVLLLAIGAVWFFTSMIDTTVLALVASAAGQTGAKSKFALDNVASLVVGGLSLAGVVMLAWGAIAGRQPQSAS